MPNDSLKVIVRGCHNFSAFNRLVAPKAELPPGVEPGLLPCSSKIEAHQILKYFEQGADGVLILSCPFGDCRLIEGNRRAAKRTAHAATWLEELGLNGSRARFLAAPGGTTEEVAGVINEFYNEIRKMGPRFTEGSLVAGGKG